MGELFGCVLSGPASLAIRWQAQRDHGHFREEGWGVSIFDGPASLTLKQADSQPDAAMTAVLGAGGLRGDVAVAYIRRWTNSARLANCHPFVRELAGREWVFAHNGRVEGLRADPSLRPGRFQPVGGTDSEYAFCVLLEALAAEVGRSPDAHADTLRRVSGQIANYGAFNYVLASEGCLYAYSSGEYGLCVAEVPGAAAQPLELADEDWQIVLRPLGEIEAACIAASNPMSAGLNWHRLAEGELVVASGGRLLPRAAVPSRPARRSL